VPAVLLTVVVVKLLGIDTVQLGGRGRTGFSSGSRSVSRCPRARWGSQQRSCRHK